MTELTLLPHQMQFLMDDSTPSIALCGGYASGKSAAGALKIIDLALKNPGCLGLVWGLSMELLKGTILRDLEQILSGEHQSIPQIPVPYTLNKSSMIFTLRPKGQAPTTIKPLTAGVPIVGYNAAFFVADELDTLGKVAARQAWDDLSARVRAGKVKQRCATTTPEGFRFMWEFFEKEVNENPELGKNRKLIRGCLLDNPWIDDDYIQNIFETRTKEQVKAYVYGHFVAFNSSTVYKDFDRNLNSTKLTIDDFNDGRPIWVGMDFNVDQMAATVAVVDNNRVLVLDELISMKKNPTIRDTAAMIAKLKSRYPNRRVIVCPDASGDNRNSASFNTNLEQLKLAGYELRHGAANPRVRDRVNSTNALFCNAMDVRRLFINVERCPHLIEGVEQQVYNDKGEPDSKQGMDHGNDALGYLVMALYPIRANVVSQARLVA